VIQSRWNQCSEVEILIREACRHWPKIQVDRVIKTSGTNSPHLKMSRLALIECGVSVEEALRR
ncbi:MAG: hypothetical protein ABIH03_11030, partial [Pseudomonadota bacterium]